MPRLHSSCFYFCSLLASMSAGAVRVPAEVHMMKKRVMSQMLSQSDRWPRSKFFDKEVEASKECA